MIYLILKRYGVEVTEEYATIVEAARAGIAAIETNVAAPARLYENDRQIWENNGPDSYERLRMLAGVGIDHE